MRRILFLVPVFFPFFLFGQAMDSITMKTVDSLIQVAGAFLGKGNFDQALEINAIAEKLALEKYGPESSTYGNTCNHHGRILLIKSEPGEAEKWLLSAKSIYEKTIDKSTATYAATLYNLGYAYEDLGKFEEAEAVLSESMAIREKVLGKSHPLYGKSLNMMGVLYYFMMNYERAEQYYLLSNAHALEYSGRMSSEYANSLYNIGQLQYTMGNLDKAETFYLEAIDIMEKTAGKDNINYAQYLNSAGVLYKELGDYEKSEKYFTESLSIFEKAFGKMHPKYARGLNNLANLYHFIGENEKAKPLLKQSIEILEKTEEKPSMTYALSLENLGSVNRESGNYEEAEQLLIKAQKTMEVALGKERIEYTWMLMNLGLFYRQTGKYKQAEGLLLAAKDIREKLLAKETILVEESLDQLAVLYWASGNYNAAGNYLKEADDIEQKILIKTARYSSEQGLAAFIHNFNGRIERDLSFTQIRPEVAPVCYDNTLFYKGFLLNAAAQINKLTLADPVNIEKFNILKSYQRRLAAEYTKPIAEQTKVAELEEKANSLEKDLVRSVAGLGEARRQVSWQEVQQKLQPGEAALEFVHYRLLTPRPTDSTMYAALLLLPGAKPPVFIPLCEEKQLQALLQTPAPSKAGYINTLYTYRANQHPSLYALLWQPLEKALSAAFAEVPAGKKAVYFSPSGLLHRLNLGAIPMPPLLSEQQVGATIADRYHLVEMGSTRQLVVPPGAKPEGSAALLYGGIQYDLDSVALKQQITVDLNANALTTRRSLEFVGTDSTLRGSKWNYLKWTDVEVSTTEALLKDAGLQPTVRKGYAATEESFKTIGTQGQPSPRVLHFATHGFFFPDPKNSITRQSSETANESSFKLSERPMIRCGLVLAGGNYAWQTGKPFRSDLEDGILTAYEISQMNLRNTELVVLSACETGLGDIQGNEGVYGLQRAFKIAGAKYLIMSLWQVPDYQTQELMTTFYSHWMLDKMTIPDAFRAAQQAMRDKYKDPFLWAGFVLVE